MRKNDLKPLNQCQYPLYLNVAPHPLELGVRPSILTAPAGAWPPAHEEFREGNPI